MKKTATITILLFFYILSIGQDNTPPPWQGEKRQDIVGSNGRILNKDDQLLYLKPEIVGFDCEKTTINRLTLEFTSGSLPKFEISTDRKASKHFYKLEIYNERRRLLGEFTLYRNDVDILEFPNARWPYVYSINVSSIPKILLRDTVSWNLVEYKRK